MTPRTEFLPSLPLVRSTRRTGMSSTRLLHLYIYSTGQGELIGVRFIG